MMSVYLAIYRIITQTILLLLVFSIRYILIFYPPFIFLNGNECRKNGPIIHPFPPSFWAVNVLSITIENVLFSFCPEQMVPGTHHKLISSTPTFNHYSPKYALWSLSRNKFNFMEAPI